MTRTFVVGEAPDEIVEYHRLCKEALDRVARDDQGRASPGARSSSWRCEIFEAAGEPTQLTKAAGRGARRRLLPRARPRRRARGARAAVARARRPTELVAGDVVTVEPGCYRQGYGGVPARGSRPRHRGRRREPDASIPYDLELHERRASDASDRDAARWRSGATRRRPSSPRRRTRSPTSTTATSRSSGSARAASASPGSSRSPSSTSGSRRTRSGTSAAS